MAEVIGLAASIIGIVAVAKTFMDAYDIVSDARHASSDPEQLVSSLQIQRVKFLLWCDYVDLIQVMRLGQKASTSNERNLEVTRLTPRIHKTYVLNSIKNTMNSIDRRFKDSHALLISYTARAETSSLAKLISMSSAGAGPLMVVGGVLWSDEAERQKKLPTNRSSISWTKRASWTFKDKRKFEKLVE
jgi:hypothetical protein